MVCKQGSPIAKSILDPSAYASDSARKLWKQSAPSQSGYLGLTAHALFSNQNFAYIYFIVKSRVSSEIEVKKRSP